MKKLKELWAVCSFVVAFIAWVVSFMLAKECQLYSERVGMPTEYSFVEGCYVDTPEGWVKKDNVIYIMDES